MVNLDIHMANVIGLGARTFSEGILRELLKNKSIDIHKIYLSNTLDFLMKEKGSKKIIEVNYLFGLVSRVFEICFWRFFNKQGEKILVLGDIPLNTRSKQYILCHQSLIFRDHNKLTLNYYKFKLFRLFFLLFLKKSDVLIVQSAEMKNNMRNFLGKNINIKLIDFNSRSFEWPNFFRKGRQINAEGNRSFKMLYPAANYPHKNHHLLEVMGSEEDLTFFLTIEDFNSSLKNNNIKFIGPVSRREVYKMYEEVDALLFLSSEESLGMPIIEAVSCNLPIICPSRGYTKDLDPKLTFFFDDNNPESLKDSILSAKEKICSGWWPSYSLQDYFSIDARHTISNILEDL